MAVVPISGLDASILSTSDFAFSRWYRGLGPWYYHEPSACSARLLDENELQAVDPGLRPLCRILHQHGLPTAPSCQGHFLPRSHFEFVWRMLIGESRLIRGPGLLLCRAGATYRFSDMHYELPWRSGSAFCKEAMQRQRDGYLGFVTSHEHAHDLQQRLASDRIAGLQIATRDVDAERTLIDLDVRSSDSSTQRRIWANVTVAIERALTREMSTR